ncbi:uncharacterized protein LOC5514038 isoform X2 [Nematostella vectensis]|uniref:uncharacterized protein LOC5514038 isoform X2 n=1 Tax=Nematostella vectensis TaxID=45351 RepID=UPI002076DDB9|nr:uncharacterized protein LOC5514038 isoform X2 [Nematostella vectensis]
MEEMEVADSPQSVLEVSVPYHPHKLRQVNPKVVYDSYNGHWKCDNCGQEHTPSSYPYNCSKCSFDLCQSCAKPHRTPAHTHPLYYVNSSEVFYQSTSGVWRCNACLKTSQELQDRFSYHCSLCEFDLCTSCFNPQRHLVHHHPLRVAHTDIVYSHTDGNWVCDVCRQTSRINERFSHHCEDCEFDVCRDCFRKHIIPSHPHPLVRADATYVYVQFNGGWRCDECGSVHGPSDDFRPWHCRECEYDICNQCLMRLDPDYITSTDVAGPPPGVGGNGYRLMSAVNHPHQDRMNVAEEPVEPKSMEGNLSESGKFITTPTEDDEYAHLCIICLENPKNATLIHGDTGHLCCCWSCAQVLKRRCDPCPICRSRIDHVIRQYGA